MKTLLKTQWNGLLLACACGILLAGCGAVTSEGDFEGVAFRPLGLAFAVHDRHAFVNEEGRDVAIRRPLADLTVDLYFADVQAVADEDWRFLSSSDQENLRNDLARSDALVIRHLPLNQVLARETLEWSTEEAVTEGAEVEGGEVSFFMAHDVDSLPLNTVSYSDRPVALGRHLDVKLVIDESEVEPSAGFVTGSLELKRGRADGQEGEVATGEVVLNFTLPIIGERVGKANAAMLAPIVRCSAARGVGSQAACDDEDAELLVDENTTF